MCGICGRFNFDGRPVSAAEITAMRDVIRHRGPDGKGLFVDASVGLGHRRLSIIDLSGGHQPLSNEDGAVTVVFNGEIYNFREIRHELEARGHVFRTHSDTEVIVHLYEDLGPECVQRLRGMFAFALWDARQRHLLLARDRLGIKPLYYVQTDQSVIFGSEIKSLLAADGLPALEPDPIGLRRYLAYRHPYGNGTLFKGVRQIPPGHYLVVGGRSVDLRRYWNISLHESGENAGLAQGFLPMLDEAVRLRMISDVPIGAFLSGGIDSSAITALMARNTAQVSTFSIGFVPDEDNELSWARLIADRCSAQHHELIQRSQDFFSLLRRLVWHHDEPLTFPASIPLYLLSRESKPVATVMLGGEGADEILGGYDSNVRTYWLNRIASYSPARLRHMLTRLPLPARARAAAARATLDEAELITGTFHLSDHAGMTAASRIPLPAGDDDDRALIEEVAFPAEAGTFLNRFLYFQLKTYLLALLMKQDKMSMAASIETRVPYLDHHLVELAFALPDNCKIRGGEGKYLLKKVSANLLPQEIIRRPKRGFPVPIARWFREPGNPFVETLLDRETLRDGLLDGDFVRARVNQFLAGASNSLELWAILNLELWRREFLVASTARPIGQGEPAIVNA